MVGACGSGEKAPRPESATPTTTDAIAKEPEPTVELVREWVAVFRVAEAQELNDEAQELFQLVPHNVAVGPIGCWVGLPEKLGSPKGESVYVSAVVAESRQELDRVVEKVGREPILLGEFPAMCVD
jgi:hypothetical protein